MRILYIKRTMLFLLFSIPSPSFPYTYPISCGACSGCVSFMPMLNSASESIEKEFLILEKEIAEKYNTEIIPLLEDNSLLEKKITAGQAQLEGMERKMLIVNTEIAEMLILIKKTRTINDEKNNLTTRKKND